MTTEVIKKTGEGKQWGCETSTWREDSRHFWSNFSLSVLGWLNRVLPLWYNKVSSIKVFLLPSLNFFVVCTEDNHFDLEPWVTLYVGPFLSDHYYIASRDTTSLAKWCSHSKTTLSGLVVTHRWRISRDVPWVSSTTLGSSSTRNPRTPSLTDVSPATTYKRSPDIPGSKQFDMVCVALSLVIASTASFTFRVRFRSPTS